MAGRREWGKGFEIRDIPDSERQARKIEALREAHQRVKYRPKKKHCPCGTRLEWNSNGYCSWACRQVYEVHREEK